MWDWLAFCGVYRTSMTGSSQTFFNEGQRNVGLMLQDQVLTHAPESYFAMLMESRKPEGSDKS